MKRISFMLLSLIIIAGGISGCTSGVQTQVKKDSSTQKENTTIPEKEENTMPDVNEQKNEEEQLNFFNEAEKTSLGVWWWGAGYLKSEKEFNRRLQFLKEHKVTEVYITYDPKMKDELFHKALKRLNEVGIRTSALHGDSSFVTDAGYESYVSWLEKLQKYQDNANEDGKFTGLHIDVEPYAIPEYRTDPTPFLPVYMKLVDTTAEFTKKNKMTSEFDVPFWYDKKAKVTTEDGEMLMVEYIIKHIDTITIMSYRDTAMKQYLDSMDLITLIKQNGKKVVLGSETQPSDEGNLITYFEEGPEVMASEMSKLRSLLKDTMEGIPFGLAIHHMNSWIDWGK